MIGFETLTMKVEKNDTHVIFLLKKNIRSDIIKIILGYLPIVALIILKGWKTAITSVRQGYKFREERYDYRTGS